MQGLIGAMSGKLFSSNREGRPCDLSITATSQHAIYESRVTTHGAHGGGLEGGGGGEGLKGMSQILTQMKFGKTRFQDLASNIHNWSLRPKLMVNTYTCFKIKVARNNPYPLEVNTLFDKPRRA